jgi:hypothetical protein
MTNAVSQYDALYPPINVPEDVRARMEPYLRAARRTFRQEYNTRVLNAAQEEMARAGEFYSLERYGDSLDSPPQW